MEQEIRAATATIDTGGDMTISGYALVFNQPSRPMPFTEVIKPTALDGVDLSHVQLLYNHDFSSILARVDANTLSLKVDDVGLHFNATLPDTTLGHDTYKNIQNGNLQGVSFGFFLPKDGSGDDWLVEDGVTYHVITQVAQINEISLTALPAYKQTSVQIGEAVSRSYEQFLKGETVRMATTKNKQPVGEVVIDPASEAKRADDVAEPETSSAASDASDNNDMVQQILSMFKSLQDGLNKMNASAQESEIDDDDEDDRSAAPSASSAASDASSAAASATSATPSQAPSAATSAATTTNTTTKAPNNGGDNKNMAKTIATDDKKSEEVRSFENFLKTGEIKRDAATVGGFDSTAGEAVIPSQVLDVLKQPEDPSQLGGYVNKVAVNAPTGKLPVMSKSASRMATAKELEANPELANATLTPVTYDVQTFRGNLPISFEMAQDYPNITALLTQYVNNIKGQTEQHEIGAVLQQATPVTATSIDDLKDAYNVGLVNYGADRVWVISETMFSELDKAKDANGRYLLEDSVASATGKTFLGATLIEVADDVLGKDGEAHAFVGSLKAFVLEAVRNNVSLSWARNEQFENVLLAALRADFKPADTAAGKFITYSVASK